jgi:hypothetical protein
LRSLDPDSMTFAALFGNPDIVFWRDVADVLSSDPYPMFGKEPAGGYSHKQVADWTAQTREAVKNARPILTVLQFFKFTSLGRWPTRAEMRNHAYMAIVEGAKGLWWWSLGNGAGALASAATCSPAGSWCPEQVAHFNDLKAVVGELADLEPVLLADDAPAALRGNSNTAAVRTKVKVVNGKGYLFAYNYTGQSVSATFTWNTAPGAVAVHAEGRSVSAGGTSFTDAFAPYQAHVYIIASGGSAGAPAPAPSPAAPTGTLKVLFTSPGQGATVSGNVPVNVWVEGHTGASNQFSLMVDGKAVGTTQTTAGTHVVFSWPSGSIPDGAHTLAATVKDAAGAVGTASRSVITKNGVVAAPAPAPAPTPTPAPAPAGLKVVFTSPGQGATVSGNVAVNVWVEGQSGGSNTFTLSVDGKTIGTRTIAGNHVTFTWPTTGVPNGSHQLTGTVRDATGKTGTSSRTATVRN